MGLRILACVGVCGLLAGCATAKPPAPVAQPICLPMVSYSKAEQTKAADELAALPPDSTLGRLVVDYGQLRAANRALCGVGK